MLDCPSVRYRLLTAFLSQEEVFPSANTSHKPLFGFLGKTKMRGKTKNFARRCELMAQGAFQMKAQCVHEFQ